MADADAAALALPLQAYVQQVGSERRLAARTVAIYPDGLQQLQALAAQVGQDVLQLQPSHIRRFVATLNSQGLHGRSIALWLSCWRGFFKWAAWEGWVDRNPVEGIRAPKSPKPLPKALGVDDAVQLAAFVNPEADPWDEARDAAMTELLYSSGLRVSELAQLDVQVGSGLGWLDLQAGLVHVTGKGGKRRSVPVGAPAKAALERWMHIRSSRFAAHWVEPALFVGARGAR
ncbi:MAG: site-specific integrase, partial [Comamonas sp.]|nr:site-specific integrase [Candidatus Comamonas equi]